MTAVSLINPYAPQPAAHTSGDSNFGAVQTTQPAARTTYSSDTGHSSDHSGQGSGHGTGTGGAQLGTLLARGRRDMAIQKATPESVVEAQSDSRPATEYLARKAQQKIEAQAAEKVRVAERVAEKTLQIKEETAKAAEPEYVMPNPLPTAPILQENDP